MNLLGKLIRPLFNIGLGQIPGVQTLYKFVWKTFGPKGIKMTKVNGFNLYVACRDWAVAPTMLFAHTWEPEETRICRKYIKKGMTVIDAGTYIGYYSILASKLVGDIGKVYSFEPSPECLDLLYKNIKLNECSNIQVIEKAVADKDGHSVFYVSPQNLSGSTMFEDYSSPGSVNDPQITIPTISLDEVIGDKKVDFIKMDIEGGETKALKGMMGIIKSNPELKMIIEVYPVGLERVGSSLDELVSGLQHYFRLYIVGGVGIEVGLKEVCEATKKVAVINLFCQGRG